MASLFENLLSKALPAAVESGFKFFGQKQRDRDLQGALDRAAGSPSQTAFGDILQSAGGDRARLQRELDRFDIQKEGQRLSNQAFDLVRDPLERQGVSAFNRGFGAGTAGLNIGGTAGSAFEKTFADKAGELRRQAAFQGEREAFNRFATLNQLLGGAQAAELNAAKGLGLLDQQRLNADALNAAGKEELFGGLGETAGQVVTELSPAILSALGLDPSTVTKATMDGQGAVHVQKSDGTGQTFSRNTIQELKTQVPQAFDAAGKLLPNLTSAAQLGSGALSRAAPLQNLTGPELFSDFPAGAITSGADPSILANFGFGDAFTGGTPSAAGGIFEGLASGAESLGSSLFGPNGLGALGPLAGPAAVGAFAAAVPQLANAVLGPDEQYNRNFKEGTIKAGEVVEGGSPEMRRFAKALQGMPGTFKTFQSDHHGEGFGIEVFSSTKIPVVLYSGISAQSDALKAQEREFGESSGPQFQGKEGPEAGAQLIRNLMRDPNWATAVRAASKARERRDADGRLMVTVGDVMPYLSKATQNKLAPTQKTQRLLGLNLEDEGGA